MMTTLKSSALFAGAAAMLALPDPSAAQDDPYVDSFLIRDGNNAGRTRKDSRGRARALRQVGAGAEHAKAVQLADGTIMVTFNSSYVLNGEPAYHRNQLAVAGITLAPTGVELKCGPVHVTRNRGDRYRNAHANTLVTAFEDTVAVALYNYADNNNNDAERMALAIDSNCNVVGEQTQIFGNREAGTNNDNFCGYADQAMSVTLYDSATRTVRNDACPGNGSGNDDGWHFSYEITKSASGQVDFAFLARQRYTRREERTRSTQFAVSKLSTETEMAVGTIYTEGNNQPPRYGVGLKLSMINRQTGEIRQVWNRTIERYNQVRPGEYSTNGRANLIDPSGTVAAVTLNRVKARRRRGKGKSEFVMIPVDVTMDGPVQLAQASTGQANDVDSTHMSQAMFELGKVGATSWQTFVLGGSINGNPASRSTAVAFDWNAESNSFVADRKYSASNLDIGWISNIYGNNPNTQGRNFVSATQIRNPGYGVDGGYQPNVQSFIAIPATTRRMVDGVLEDKLAIVLDLVPAIVDPEVPEVGTSDNDQADPTNPENDTPEALSSSAQGACLSSVGGTSSSLGTLALLGLAVLSLRRRRSVA